MPVSEEILRKEIQKGKIKPVYLLFGDDSYLVNHYSSLIVKKTISPNDPFNYHHFEGDINCENIVNACNQMPMMADKKCVVVDDFDISKASKDDMDNLFAVVGDPSEDCVLIFKFDGVQFSEKGKNEAALISRCEKGGGMAVSLNHRSKAALSSMLSKGAAKRGVKLPDSVSKYLIESVGEDINVLSRELDKICAFVKTGDVSKETVDKVCTKTVDASVYDYVDVVVEGNATSALKLLDGMFYMHFEPYVILFWVCSRYTDIYRVYSASKQGKPISQVSSDFNYGKKAFVLDRLKKKVTNLDFDTVKKSMDILVETDNKLKLNGADARTVLEEMTVKLCYITAFGGKSLDPS